jgi:hypothetical protein
MDEVLAAFLAAVSFEAGGAPDYGRIRELFVPGGILVRTPDGPVDVEGFIAPRQATFESGALTEFSETELDSVTEVFGRVAHRMSGYAKAGVLNGEAFSTRGVISTQFVLTDDGWRISAMAWDDEREGLSLTSWQTSR